MSGARWEKGGDFVHKSSTADNPHSHAFHANIQFIRREQPIIPFAIEFEAGVSELPMASPRRKVVYGGERVAESIQMIKQKVPCVTKIMQETRYGRHKPSPKRGHMKQGSLKSVHSWRRSNTEGKREPVTPLLELHFVTVSVPRCHRKLFLKPTSEKTKNYASRLPE